MRLHKCLAGLTCLLLSGICMSQSTPSDLDQNPGVDNLIYELSYSFGR